MNRREFLRSTAALGLLAAADSQAAEGGAPAVIDGQAPKPVVISSRNGNFFKHGGNVTCVELGFRMITQGSDVLDALLAGVNLVELDPAECYVGYGGLPNAEGVVQLDACCMHGPTKRAGGVAALEGVRTPSLVAKAVMELTDHHLLVGKGAQKFARNLGFKIEDDLNTDMSRKAWLEWKRKTDPGHYLDPKKRSQVERNAIRQMARAGIVPCTQRHGTINCDGINAKGEVCGVTTTSGLPFKIPGRVGDSPILGAGLYVDGAVGAVGSTGRGEANLYNLTSFLIVENLRRGMHPKDAGMEALRRIRANTVEKRLRKANGDPNFNVSFYILNARGEHAGVAMYGENEEERGYAGQTDAQFVLYSYCDENGPRTVRCEPLLPGTPQG
ncbi:MAG: N(4)-(beta-N-acetylglucosaminyl)-L-asparaginase [Limisphaerales bacterium]